MIERMTKTLTHTYTHLQLTNQKDDKKGAQNQETVIPLRNRWLISWSAPQLSHVFWHFKLNWIKKNENEEIYQGKKSVFCVPAVAINSILGPYVSIKCLSNKWMNENVCVHRRTGVSITYYILDYAIITHAHTMVCLALDQPIISFFLLISFTHQTDRSIWMSYFIEMEIVLCSV